MESLGNKGLVKIVGIVLAVCLLLTTIPAHDVLAKPVPKLTVDVWTDKGGQGLGMPGGQYSLGERPIIFFTVSIACRTRITLSGPAETNSWEQQASYGPVYQLTLGDAEQSDVGQWRVVLQAMTTTGDQTASDTTSFIVVEPYTPPPSQAPPFEPIPSPPPPASPPEPTPPTSPEPSTPPAVSELRNTATSLDALKALKMTEGTLPADLAMDADGDGQVTERDAYLLLEWAVWSPEHYVVKLDMVAPGDLDLPAETISGIATPDSKAVIERNGMTLVIPPGAVSEDTEVVVKECKDLPPTPVSAESKSAPEALAISKVYDFGPEGLTFQKPVTITLPYDDTKLPSGVDSENVQLAYFNGRDWIAMGGVVDSEKNTVSIRLEEFPGVWWIMVWGPPVLLGLTVKLVYDYTYQSPAPFQEDTRDLTDEECNAILAEASKGLDDAVKRIKKMKEDGSSSTDIANAVVTIVENRLTAVNNFVRAPGSYLVLDPLGAYRNLDEWRALWCFEYDVSAIWAWNNRVGQCEEHAAVVYYILKNAGVNCDICGKDPGDHKFVVINMGEDISKTDSSEWDEMDWVHPEDVPVIADAWQGRALNGTRAWGNRFIMNCGESKIRVDTPGMLPQKGLEEITARNLVWDAENLTWKCRKGTAARTGKNYVPCRCFPKEKQSESTEDVSKDKVWDANSVDVVVQLDFPEYGTVVSKDALNSAAGSHYLEGSFEGNIFKGKMDQTNSVDDVEITLDDQGSRVVSLKLTNTDKNYNRYNQVVIAGNIERTPTGSGWRWGYEIEGTKACELVSKVIWSSREISFQCSEDSVIRITFGTGP